MDPPTSTVPAPPTRADRAVATVFLQDACLEHQYIRTRDSSHIFERPQRLRAVKIGVCAAISHLEEIHPVPAPAKGTGTGTSEDQDLADSLVEAVEKLKLDSDSSGLSLPNDFPIKVVQSSAKVDILHSPAVKYIHGDVDGDVYLEKLVSWARESAKNIESGQSEIPEGLPQGDLYMCPTSVDAIQGALGTVCEAVDAVLEPSKARSPDPPRRAFVAVRPPGHHCGEDTPCGFCFVNNVAVGAAHAHLKHGVMRVVILDIDLHHGNGTQSIAWQINEETYRVKLEAEAGAPVKPGLQVYYGSVHDVLSFPCEDGKLDMIQAASVSIHGPHGQHVENVHLEPFESEEQFWDVLYRGAYSRLLRKAEDFIQNTGGPADDVVVFISAGFDASEHETPSMSRHGRKVPTAFFYRFTQDVCAFADQWARGRVVSVLEGGYNDRALLSGALAHLAGLADGERISERDESRHAWWSVENVEMLERLAKKRRRPKTSLGAPPDAPPPAWFDRTAALLARLDPAGAEPSSGRNAFIPPSTRTLRERRPVGQGPSTKPGASPRGKKTAAQSRAAGVVASASSDSGSTESEVSPPTATKKLPRVILKVGPRPEA
ncbi:histone deacetylase domain-containing protein [Gloeopeniophorella convolvens]|nr:histone deacetylase domain-containing protein [Gloeopeniophorella convolvens]